MALTLKQRQILSHVRIYGKITKQEAIEIISTSYANGQKYVGEVLSRMVGSGLLIREKPGVFSAGVGKKEKPATIENNQTSLEL